jgi:large subunit ribosomal protein L7/L12
MAEEKEEIQIPKKLEDIVKKIEELTVLDLAELVKILEKKFGVSAVPTFAVPAPTVSAQTSAPSPLAEEKTAFNIVLTSAGEKKIEVIKIVRDITGKGLKESKDLVDALANAPQVIKENAKKEEAEEIKKKLEAVGAKVELK